MESKKEERIFQYDLMRVVFMLMVLGVHVLSCIKQFMEPYNTTWYAITIATDLFMIGNPLFFMLSGKFNLNKNFSEKEDYKKFYVKRVMSIILPFIIVSILVYIINNTNLSVVDYLQKMLAGKISGTYWFIYYLIGILILSPFFSKLLKNLSLWEKKLFLLIGFCMNAFITIWAFFKIPNMMTFATVGLVGWHFYYFAGYLIEDIFPSKKQRNILIIIGVVALISQILIRRFMNYSYRLTDPSPLLTLQAFGLYVFLLDKVKINITKIQKAISKVAQYSFTFYLLHMVVVSRVANLFPLKITATHNMLFGVCIFVISFVITLGLSIVIQKIIINPLKKILEKGFTFAFDNDKMKQK